MFEYVVQVLADEKIAQFELDLSDWIGHSKLDQCLDVVLGSIMIGVLVSGAYNLFTFSLGGK